jgi:hypothetical protein
MVFDSAYHPMIVHSAAAGGQASFINTPETDKFDQFATEPGIYARNLFNDRSHGDPHRNLDEKRKVSAKKTTVGAPKRGQ